MCIFRFTWIKDKSKIICKTFPDGRDLELAGPGAETGASHFLFLMVGGFNL